MEIKHFAFFLYPKVFQLTNLSGNTKTLWMALNAEEMNFGDISDVLFTF